MINKEEREQLIAEHERLCDVIDQSNSRCFDIECLLRTEKEVLEDGKKKKSNNLGKTVTQMYQSKLR